MKAPFVVAGTLLILAGLAYVFVFNSGSCPAVIVGASPPAGAPLFTGCARVDNGTVTLVVLTVLGGSLDVYGLWPRRRPVVPKEPASRT